MLIVVAILAVLMTIVFRLGGMGGQDQYKAQTIVRMQKIENCLSGYYAAFGSYPPVRVYGSRDIYCKLNEAGDQDPGEGRDSVLNWEYVKAACRSQPIGCEYPPSEDEEKLIEEWAQEVSARVGNAEEYPYYSQGKWSEAHNFSGATITGPNPNSGGFNEAFQEGGSEWNKVKLFKFGVMSFLLPRYLFMMGGNGQFFGKGRSEACVQWADNNDLPCDPFEGESFNEWNDVRRYAQVGDDYGNRSDSEKNRNDLARIANIPSQAVCARWMPNLEGVCRAVSELTFFGINICEYSGLQPQSYRDEDGEAHPPETNLHLPPSGGSVYRNAFVTIEDGWDREFYYYSPAPYQSYTVWSAGKNGKTFPPWMDVNSLNSSERQTAMEWKSDDIMQMNH